MWHVGNGPERTELAALMRLGPERKDVYRSTMAGSTYGVFMSYFNPLDLQKRFAVVHDYARRDPIQVYPVERAVRIPGAKLLGEVLAFDHREA